MKTIIKYILIVITLIAAAIGVLYFDSLGSIFVYVFFMGGLIVLMTEYKTDNKDGKEKPTPKRLSDYNSNSSYDNFIAEEYEKEDECYKDMMSSVKACFI